MKINKLVGVVSATMLAWAAVAAPASAGVWNFLSLGGNPSSPGASLGVNSYTFTNGAASLTANTMTYSGSWAAGGPDLYIKNGEAAAEDGLGLAQDTYGNNEIAYPYGIELTGFSGHISSLSIGSLQIGESWQVLGSNDGTNWTLLGSGSGTPVSQSFSDSSLLGYSDLLVWDNVDGKAASGSNNIILESVTTVPEPGTLALLGLGLAGVAFAASRRRKAKSQA